MSVLPYQTIKALCAESAYSEGSGQEGLVWPFNEREVIRGKSYGVSHCGYDIRIKLPEDKSTMLLAPGTFLLASSVERIKMPNDLVAIVHDKSSWARLGLALQNTVLEPGWEGFITLELTTHRDWITIYDGDPIAQLIFHRLEEATEKPYVGKYQNQADRPVEAINEVTVA